MRLSIMKVASVASLCVLFNTAAFADIEDKLEQSFDVDKTASLRLNNINGSVEINTWSKDVIKVSAVVIADSQSDRDNIKVEMQQTSRGVNVETHYDKNQSNRNHSTSGKVEYVVTVPSYTELSAIELVNGSLLIDGVKGEIKAELVNGSIKAKGVENNGEFSSVNGSIKVHYSELATTLDEIDIETVNGSIKLYVPDSISATVNADTMHGSIKTDFGLAVEKNFFSGRHLSGNIGNGDVKITMESVNGSVKLLDN